MKNYLRDISVKGVWPRCLLIIIEEVWPRAICNGKGGVAFCLSVTVKEAGPVCPLLQ